MTFPGPPGRDSGRLTAYPLMWPAGPPGFFLDGGLELFWLFLFSRFSSRVRIISSLKTDLFEEKRALRKKEAGDLFRIGPQKMKKEPLDQEREREWSCPRNAELRRKKPAGWIRVGSRTSLLRLCRDPPSGGPEQIPPSLGVVDVSEGRSNPIQKGVLFQGLNISNFQHFS